MFAHVGGDTMKRRFALQSPELRVMNKKQTPMTPLNIEPNLENFDAFYEALIEMHRDLSPEKSHAVNAKLVLLLANHIGDFAVLKDAMQRALK